MKGQISFVEFIVSTTLFVLFVSYFAFQILIYVPSYVAELKNERVRGEAYQISEMLVNDFGEPRSWNSVVAASRIGLAEQLSNRTNVINSSKITFLNTGCSGIGFDSVKRKLGTDLNFSLVLTNKQNNQVLLDCRPYFQTRVIYNSTIKRFFVVNNTPAELTVQVWSK